MVLLISSCWERCACVDMHLQLPLKLMVFNTRYNWAPWAGPCLRRWEYTEHLCRAVSGCSRSWRVIPEETSFPGSCFLCLNSILFLSPQWMLWRPFRSSGRWSSRVELIWKTEPSWCMRWCLPTVPLMSATSPCREGAALAVSRYDGLVGGCPCCVAHSLKQSNSGALRIFPHQN